MGLTTAINQAIAKNSDTLSDDARLLKDGAVVGNWRVLGLIGKGGNGEVYRVKNLSTGVVGALKAPHGGDPHQRERFNLEQEILIKVTSKASRAARHFPRLLDKGNIPAGDTPFIVIEFLHRLELHQTPNRPMKDLDVSKLMLALCEALRHLHKNGYLHRDIKPENLMQRENKEIVLIDFGLAVRINDVKNPLAKRTSLTQGQVRGVGTEGSMAPEQAFGHASIRSDVYALGALADDCFCGNPPPAWIQIVQRAISPKANHRYRDVGEFEIAVRKCVLRTHADHAKKILRTPLVVLCVLVLAALILFYLADEKKPMTNNPQGSVHSHTEIENTDGAIPPSLANRMLEADLMFQFRDSTVSNDLLEAVALVNVLTNYEEISARPRGQMEFANEHLSEKELSTIWPFDFETFEETLESQLVIDTNGLYRLRSNADSRLPAGENSLDHYFTIRYVNQEIETWAIKQLDKTYSRMTDNDLCAMLGEENASTGAFAWIIAEDVYFVIERCKGPLSPRLYRFVKWPKTDTPFVFATFDSFPNRREVATVLPYRESPAAANNLAVLMWRHQCDRSQMRPWLIKNILELAQQDGLPVASKNLETLYQHMPEIFR